MVGSPDTAEIGELYRRASHALRTPLAIVMLELGMMDSEVARRRESDLQAYGESVRRTFLYLRCLSGDIGEGSDADLCALAQSVVLQSEAAAGARSVSLELAMQGTHRREGYPGLLEEGLLCVVENAIRHTPPDGRVTVTCGEGGARIVVDDSGPGYPPAVLAGTVEPFENVSGEGMALGIGLPLAALATRLNGGQLHLARSGLGGARAVFDFAAA